MSDSTHYYEHPEIVEIDNRKISFLIPFANLHVTVKVKQKKGLGTADADDLTDLNHYHMDLLSALLLPHQFDRVWTANDILYCTKFWLQTQAPIKYRNFKENNWRRPISEFLRKGILVLVDGEYQKYRLDVDKAKRAKETEKFDM